MVQIPMKFSDSKQTTISNILLLKGVDKRGKKEKECLEMGWGRRLPVQVYFKGEH